MSGEPIRRTLAVGPRTGLGDTSWTATLHTDRDPPEVTILAPVSSYDDAVARARAHNCDTLGFTDGVLAEMTAAGVGPPTARQRARAAP